MTRWYITYIYNDICMIIFPPKTEFVSDPKKGVNEVEIFGPLVNMFITPKYIHFHQKIRLDRIPRKMAFS